MKYLNTIITVCFVVVFAGTAYITTERTTTFDVPTALPSAPVAPVPDDAFVKSKPGYKSMPGGGSIIGEEKPIKEPRVEPAPKSAPVPPHSAVVQTEDLAKNEYVRGAIGAVIGWVVKGLCEFLFGIVTPILSFLKEALMRRFG